MRRRPQLIPWKAAGLVTEQQASGDDVVRTTGWVFNNEKRDDLTLEEFVATGDAEAASYLTVFGLREPDLASETLVEIGCGIGRMTCAFTREFEHVIACDLDAGFLERIRDDDCIQRPLFKRLKQVGGEVFLDDQFQIGRGLT